MNTIQLLDISERRASRALAGLLWVMAAGAWTAANAAAEETTRLDRQLATVLYQNAFTGQVECSLPRRLGRALDPNLVNVGRMLWFDTITGVHDDNTCEAAIPRPTALVTRSRSRLASKAISSWDPIGKARAISAARPRR